MDMMTKNDNRTGQRTSRIEVDGWWENQAYKRWMEREKSEKQKRPKIEWEYLNVNAEK